jgi:hypothetical protein
MSLNQNFCLGVKGEMVDLSQVAVSKRNADLKSRVTVVCLVMPCPIGQPYGRD